MGLSLSWNLWLSAFKFLKWDLTNHLSENIHIWIIGTLEGRLSFRTQPRWRYGRKSLPKLDHFSLLWAEGEDKMYRIYMYRDMLN